MPVEYSLFREERRRGAAGCPRTLCHPEMPPYGLCMCEVSLWVTGTTAPGCKAAGRWVPGSLHGAGAPLPCCDAGAGWEGQGLHFLLSQGIFPMWAVPAHGVPKHNHSPCVSLSVITACGCLQCQTVMSSTAIAACGCPQLQSQHVGIPECNQSLRMSPGLQCQPMGFPSAMPAPEVP